MKRSGLGWVSKLAAGLGHGRSLGVRGLLENQIGRNVGSDLSEGVGVRTVVRTVGWVIAPSRCPHAKSRGCADDHLGC